MLDAIDIWRTARELVRWRKALALVMLTASPALGGEVVDGDTLRLNGEAIRLYGIDAFELDQPLGPAARAALGDLIAGRDVSCVQLDTDRWGRVVARCTLDDGTDLGGWLVSHGFALAFRRYSFEYVDHEDQARRARRGAWAGEFVPPWEWRKR